MQTLIESTVGDDVISARMSDNGIVVVIVVIIIVIVITITTKSAVF